MPFIRTCGLAPSKAKNLAAMSRALVAEHGGEVPRDFAALEHLAGVGHKTASVVMAQAFGEPAFPVDTHIHRLAGRWQLSRGAQRRGGRARSQGGVPARTAGTRSTSRSSTSAARTAPRAATTRPHARSAAGRCRRRAPPASSLAGPPGDPLRRGRANHRSRRQLPAARWPGATSIGHGDVWSPCAAPPSDPPRPHHPPPPPSLPCAGSNVRREHALSPSPSRSARHSPDARGTGYRRIRRSKRRFRGRPGSRPCPASSGW